MSPNPFVKDALKVPLLSTYELASVVTNESLKEPKMMTSASKICVSIWFGTLLQSYHDPENEEESEAVSSRVVAGSSVSSTSTSEQPDPLDDRLEGEEREDLPDQPPPIMERPIESKSCSLMSVYVSYFHPDKESHD